ncbi:MAG: cell division protein ZapE [Candidatus Thioglobus sp.]|nr:MAG: cell division protein ZapE [Candidatus Thioglobus sp.]
MLKVNQSLRAQFLEKLTGTNSEADENQILALNACAGALEQITQGLERGRKRDASLLDLIRSKFHRKVQSQFQGIYLWGSVGRGKTVMMDAVLDELSGFEIQRTHFHRFMLDVHKRLKKARLKTSDPLQQVGKEIAQHVQILGLDEFHVSDIGDAMILSELLHALVQNKVVLIMTSNTPPSALYADGLQRDYFLPTISLIESSTKVIQVKGNRDHRLEKISLQPAYDVLDDHQSVEKMLNLLINIDPQSVYPAKTVSINNREIFVKGVGKGVIWFDFEALCGGTRSKSDYVELSKTFHTLLLSEVPILTEEDDNAARRFIDLIDELYDRKVNIFIVAKSAPNRLYRGTRLKDDFKRTASRLIEIQSSEYLALAHRP